MKSLINVSVYTHPSIKTARKTTLLKSTADPYHLQCVRHTEQQLNITAGVPSQTVLSLLTEGNDRSGCGVQFRYVPDVRYVVLE